MQHEPPGSKCIAPITGDDKCPPYQQIVDYYSGALTAAPSAEYKLSLDVGDRQTDRQTDRHI